MRYYSDPTAAKALSGINREFSRLEKKAKHLRKLRDEGKISPQALEQAQKQFKGLYRHVLDFALAEKAEKDPPVKPGGPFTTKACCKMQHALIVYKIYILLP